MDKNLFDAAIVDENGIITNILVFDNKETMHEFGALRLAPRQRIGDKYIEPKEPSLSDILRDEINSV